MDELNENCQEHVNISKQMHSIIKNMHDEVFFGNFFWDCDIFMITGHIYTSNY